MPSSAKLTAEPRGSNGDLLEGIRAAVIDEDRTPVWRDDTDSLRPEEVAAMLALGEGELRLSRRRGEKQRSQLS